MTEAKQRWSIGNADFNGLMAKVRHSGETVLITSISSQSTYVQINYILFTFKSHCSVDETIISKDTACETPHF